MKSLTLKLQSKKESFKISFRNLVKKVEKLVAEKKKKMAIWAIVFFMANLAYSLFSIYSILSFGCMFAGFLIYLKINIKEMKKKGLIAYLPSKHQKMLLQRSVFDVLCDMWFIPKVSVYFKAIVSPFFIKIEPTEAINQFKDLPTGARKAILTKGVINILPSFAKTALLPENELVTDESDTSFHVEDQKGSSSELLVQANKDQEKVKTNVLSSDDNAIEDNTGRIKQSLTLEKNNKALDNRLTQASTDDDSLVNHNFSISKQLEVKKSFPSFSEVNPLLVHLDYYDRPRDVSIKQTQIKTRYRNLETRTKPKVEKKFLHDSESSDLRSEILSSNKSSARKIRERAETSETWDKLELFVKKHREKLLKQKLSPNIPTKKVEFKGALQTLQNIASLLSKDGLMNKLDNKKLMKIFLISSAALLLQFSISKKTRIWCYNTLNILMYITGFTLSTGSMAIIAIKMKEKYRKWKEERNLEIMNAAAQKEEEKDQ